MSLTTIQEILPLVERPSRYLGSEINAVKKDHGKVKLSFALAFPDLYEIGTSHFGLQILYHILNRHDEIAAERVYAPAVDMEAYLRASGVSITSLESQKPLDRFDIVGFSLLYELNFTNIITILELGNIPVFAQQRDGSHPLVIAGGPCTCNPEPVADFFDAMVIGDGENVIMEMSRLWLDWQEAGKREKKVLLKRWSEIEGVYVPEFFSPRLNTAGFQILVPEFPHYRTVKRALVTDLDGAPFPEAPIIPYGKPVHDRLRLEISRGCTRGCRFCQAGMIYRPVRERSVETLMALAQHCLATTGYEDVSLLSLSTGDYSCIVPLMERLMVRYESSHIAVSLPSLRAETLTPELMNLVRRVRKTGFTIAPEAGSQRLRDVINKDIKEEDIVKTVQHAFLLGWQVIKLYFMIGLPTETDEDLRAIVNLVKKLKKIKTLKGPKAKLNVSVATFIPKPHTPFQWSSQVSLTEAKQKIFWLKKHLNLPGVQFKWQNPEASTVEGLWARGDRRLGRLLLAAYKKGCKFDGWTDKFQYDLWQEAVRETGLSVEFYTTRKRDTAEPLPWDHIDVRVTRTFLENEWRQAQTGSHTGDCRNGECVSCGVCDFESIEPKVFRAGKETAVQTVSTKENKKTFYKKVKVCYSKQGQAKYFGHLELVKILLRAIRRAGIPVQFSQGFHPKPKISFEDPLPIGLESLQENFYLSVAEPVQPEALTEGLNKHLPGGLQIIDCNFVLPAPDSRAPSVATYLVIKKDGVFDTDKIYQFEQRDQCLFEHAGSKGRKKTIDLKKTVLTLALTAPNRLQLSLSSEPGTTVRPFDVVEKIFNCPKEKIKQAKVIKIAAEAKPPAAETVNTGTEKTCISR